MRLAIVYNSHAVIEHFKQILSGEEMISVVGAFSTGKDALRGLKRASAEMVLAGLDLPDMTDVEFIQQAKNRMPGLDVLIYTHCEDRDRVFSAFKAGASGYLLKGTRPGELIEAIESLHQGGAPMSPRIARMLVSELHKKTMGGRFPLTSRERGILSCLDKSMTYKEIAGALEISPFTVRTHIRNIYEKIEVKSKEEAIRKARKNGII